MPKQSKTNKEVDIKKIKEQVNAVLKSINEVKFDIPKEIKK